jgi:hypothetical protein
MKIQNNAKLNMKKFLGLSALCLMILMMFAAAVPAKDKKYGIFVGITDYPGLDSDLPGAAPDAKNIQSLLMSKYRFPAANTVLLLDRNATRDKIIATIKSYGQLIGMGDVLVFHYSGHGSLFWDRYSDELDETRRVEVPKYNIPLDYYDSTIVPWDAALKTSGKPWGNQILDDELYNLFAEITRKGATVVFISDSCHSGTISKAEASKTRIRFMAPEQALGVSKLTDLKLTTPKNQIKIESRNMNGSYIVLSAARDDQSAIDATDPRTNRSFGLFTEMLIRVINSSTGPMTYKRLIELVAPGVSSVAAYNNTDQNPQLDTRFGNADTLLFEPTGGSN